MACLPVGRVERTFILGGEGVKFIDPLSLALVLEI